jgi:hypothetical protein
LARRAKRGGSYPHARYGVDLSKVPDTYIEPFTAYRAWDWTEEGIKSLNGVLWTPKQAFEAYCSKAAGWEAPPEEWSEIEKQAWREEHQHKVPSPSCTCGMYAGINMQHLIDINYIGRGIHGEVSLWGRLYRHTLGWRAQFAYPRFFVVPVGMVPFDMTEAQRRLAQLTEFGVDIFLQKEREARVGQERIPLYIQEYGYSRQGLDFLVEKRANWYRNQNHDPIAHGDRLAVFATNFGEGGIGIVTEVKGDDVFYMLFSPNVIYHKNVRDIRWNDQNWRWETTGQGSMRRLEQAMGKY